MFELASVLHDASHDSSPSRGFVDRNHHSARKMMEPTAETNRCSMDTLADDMQRHVQEFLEGADCCRAGGAIKRWRALQDERWWHLKTKLDFCVGRWDANDEPSWRAAYARCRVGPSAARWAAGPTRAHGLGDRVAAPQMFLSPDGRRLYNYGGWTSPRAPDRLGSEQRGRLRSLRARRGGGAALPALPVVWCPGASWRRAVADAAVAARRRRGAVSGARRLARARGVSAGRRPRAPDPGVRRRAGRL